MRPLLYRLSYLARKGAQDRAIGFREQVKFHATSGAPRRRCRLSSVQQRNDSRRAVVAMPHAPRTRRDHARGDSRPGVAGAVRHPSSPRAFDAEPGSCLSRACRGPGAASVCGPVVALVRPWCGFGAFDAFGAWAWCGCVVGLLRLWVRLRCGSVAGRCRFISGHLAVDLVRPVCQLKRSSVSARGKRWRYQTIEWDLCSDVCQAQRDFAALRR